MSQSILAHFACWRLSASVVVCNTAGGLAGRARAVGWPTLHGGPVVLRPVRASGGDTLLREKLLKSCSKVACSGQTKCSTIFEF